MLGVRFWGRAGRGDAATRRRGEGTVCFAASPRLPVPASLSNTLWKAIDVEVEERLDRQLRRPTSWRQMLFRWLYEYNRY